MTETNVDLHATSTRQQIALCLRALDDKKAADMRVLYLGAKSSVADYFVLATGTSGPHLKALMGELEKTLKDLGSPVLGSDNSPESGWVVVDAYDCIYHIFTEEMRSFYNLESLWRDADRVDVRELMTSA